MNNQLLDYIKSKSLAGDSKDKIKQDLLSVGWKEEDIENSFQEFDNQNNSLNNIPKPSNNLNQVFTNTNNSLEKSKLEKKLTKLFVIFVILFLISYILCIVFKSFIFFIIPSVLFSIILLTILFLPFIQYLFINDNKILRKEKIFKKIKINFIILLLVAILFTFFSLMTGQQHNNVEVKAVHLPQ